MTDLRQAAQAVIDRWDSPLWKNGSTAAAIGDLRTALEQQAEPVMLNGLTEAETNATASVLGLTKQAEPVAFVNADHLQGLTLGHYGYVEIYTYESAGSVPLYTTPPQREPLTDELEAAFKDGWQSAKAAHGIKEGT